MTRTTIFRLLLAVLAAAAVAVAASPRSSAAGPTTASRFSITVDGYEIASFADAKVADKSVVLLNGFSRGGMLAYYLSQGRQDVEVVLYSSGAEVARWNLENAWPTKLELGRLDPGGVAIESITLCHEGFEIQ